MKKITLIISIISLAVGLYALYGVTNLSYLEQAFLNLEPYKVIKQTISQTIEKPVEIIKESIKEISKQILPKKYLVALVDPYSQIELDDVRPLFIFGGDSGQRPTNYKTTLARSLTATASTTETIYVSSLTTKDSHTLTTSDIGDFIAFHINSGASNDEIIACTGVNTTLVAFTGCSRGYSFYSNSVLSGNEKAHSAGETIIISNDDAWLKTQYTANDDDETIYGKWTFSTTTVAGTKLYFGPDGAYIFYNNVSKTIGFASSSAGTEYAFNNNGTTFTPIVPLKLTGGNLSFATSSTATYFDLDANGNAILKFMSNGGIGAVVGGVHISTSTALTWSGDQTFSGQGIFNSTTTISANSTTNGAFKINNINYKWPSNENASSSVIQSNGSGSLTWMPMDWQQLGETTLTAVASTISVSSLPARNDLRISIYIASSTDPTNTPRLTFNSDVATNYSYAVSRFSISTTHDLNSASSQAFILLNPDATSTPQYFNANVTNSGLYGDTARMVLWDGVAGLSNLSIPWRFSGSGIWSNSAQITSVTLTATAGNFRAGSRITVYGKRD